MVLAAVAVHHVAASMFESSILPIVRVHYYERSLEQRLLRKIFGDWASATSTFRPAIVDDWPFEVGSSIGRFFDTVGGPLVATRYINPLPVNEWCIVSAIGGDANTDNEAVD